MQKELSQALLAASKVIQNPTKNAKNPFLKNQYADLGAVIEVVKQALLDSGVFVMQSCKEENGTLNVETIFVHGETGSFVSVNVAVRLKDVSPQGSMGAFTYGRRYGLLASFNLAAEDDDGNTASGKSEDVTLDKIGIQIKSTEQAAKGIGAILGKKESK